MVETLELDEMDVEIVPLPEADEAAVLLTDPLVLIVAKMDGRVEVVPETLIELLALLLPQAEKECPDVLEGLIEAVSDAESLADDETVIDFVTLADVEEDATIERVYKAVAETHSVLLTERVCCTLTVPEEEYESVSVADVDDVNDVDDDSDALDTADKDEDTDEDPLSDARADTDGVSEVCVEIVPDRVAETD